MYKKKIPTQCKPIEEWTRKEFVDEINSKFIYCEKTASVIYNALKYQKHCIFWGPKGHAKSEIVEYALRMVLPAEEYYLKTFITGCGAKMKSEPFEGYQSLPAFKEGKMVTVMDDSMFVSKEYAILDEGLAAPGALLLFLRDTITRGEICVNGACYTNITKCIFLCTNVNPETWVENAADDDDKRSRDSFLDRFLYRRQVVWSKYDEENFSELFINQTGADEPVWADICAQTRKVWPSFSPRSALQGLHLYRSEDSLEALVAFDGATDEIYAMWQKIEKDKAYISEASRIARESKDLEGMLKLSTITGPQARIINARSNALVNQLQKLKIPKDAKLYESLGDTRKRLLEVSSASYDKAFVTEPQPVEVTAW